MKKPKIKIEPHHNQPECWCDQQITHPHCPARKAGWRVGSDMACSVPPKNPPTDSYRCTIDGEGVYMSCYGHPTRKAAREWAKDWCRTVGAALMEKGK
jgi:hypothetical protein